MSTGVPGRACARARSDTALCPAAGVGRGLASSQPLPAHAPDQEFQVSKLWAPLSPHGTDLDRCGLCRGCAREWASGVPCDTIPEPPRRGTPGGGGTGSHSRAWGRLRGHTRRIFHCTATSTPDPKPTRPFSLSLSLPWGPSGRPSGAFVVPLPTGSSEGTLRCTDTTVLAPSPQTSMEIPVWKTWEIIQQHLTKISNTEQRGACKVLSENSVPPRAP